MIGVSTALLPVIDGNKNLSAIWDVAKLISTVGTFERFILALDLLYLLGLIDMYNNNIVRVKS